MNKRFRNNLRKTLFAGLMVLVSCAQPGGDRAHQLGEALICICGCNQLLTGCTMINCPSSKPMREELAGYIDQGMTDEMILATFVDRYDKKVLSAPPTSDWFNLSAWVMPFIALIGGGVMMVYFLRRWKAAAPAEEPVAMNTSKYDAEIEEELKQHSPED